MLLDTFGRSHNYLRISITDNCNFRCFYCMPEDDYDFTPPARLMQKDEIIHLTKLFVDLGVNKIRLTGGEPLMRKDAGEIIEAISSLPVSLFLTTNGTRLHEFEATIKNAGIKVINISLDTLNREKFLLLTKRNQFDLVYKNILLMIDKGVRVKVNMVVMKGINENEINDFIEWTKNTAIHIRFIEFMPFTGNKWTSNKVFTWEEILGLIGKRFSFVPLENDKNDTAKSYSIEGHLGSFSVISTMSAPFCSTCNRIRLTADGKLKNCLFSKDETDLLTAYRKGEDVINLIQKNILNKKKELGGQFNNDYENLNPEIISNRSMINIGG
ncbi:MAG: GTP 3',8-cyclase MoaA [Ferruginibacter sp.]|nr:GTP 3',8-cyclase MoaA [Ferruginibacter sp.]